MLKHSIRWIVPLVVLFVLTIALVAGFATHIHAAGINGPVAGPGNATPTTPINPSPNGVWNW